MTNNNSIRRGRHAVSELHAHLVFVTKYHHNIFTQDHLQVMKTIMEKVCIDFGATLTEFNGETNHVHLLIHYPPTVQLSKLINSLKGVSSRRLRQQFPELAKHYWRANVLWSPSYYAGSAGGAPLEAVRRYIENQQAPGA